MSRYYRMEVKVSNFDPKRMKAICEALTGMWEFVPVDMPGKREKKPKIIILIGEDTLSGGKSDDEFANDLAQAVWHTNGRYCHVEVESTYLEATPPSDIHTWTKGDYKEWLLGQHMHDSTNQKEITNAINQTVSRKKKPGRKSE